MDLLEQDEFSNLQEYRGIVTSISGMNTGPLNAFCTELTPVSPCWFRKILQQGLEVENVKKYVMIFGATISGLECPAELIEQKNKKPENDICIIIKKAKAGKDTLPMRMHVFDKLLER